MTQYRAGVLRLENSSSTARASWTATVPADSDQQFTDGEALAFAPSGATGLFLSLDPVARELRFFRLSGAPAAGDLVTGGASGEEVTIAAAAADTDFAGTLGSVHYPLLVDGVTSDVFQKAPPSGADALSLIVDSVPTPWTAPTLHGARYALALDVSERLFTFDAALARLILPGAGDILLPQILRWNARVLERVVNRMQVISVTADLELAGKLSARLYALTPGAAATRTLTLSPVSPGGWEVGQVLHFRNRNATHNLQVACGSGVQVDDSATTLVLAPGAARTIAHVASDRWYTLTQHP